MATDNINETCFMICKKCIIRLRDAYSFKNQIEIAQISLLESIKIKSENDNESCESTLDMYEDMFCEEVKSDDSDESDEIHEEILSNRVKKKNKRERIVNKKKISAEIEIKEKLSFCSSNISDDSKSREESETSSKKQLIGIKKSQIESYKLDKNDLTCKICNETFPLHNSLVRHIPVHFPNYICHICAKNFMTRVKLDSHLFRHRQIHRKCTICNKEYKGRDNLKRHMKSHDEEESKSIYKCPHCSEKFPTYYKRIRHLVEVHNDEAKKYKCKHCFKRYNQAASLSRHIRNVHLQERKHVCTECGNAFFCMSGLNEHMLIHSDIRNFKCTVCLKSFKRKFTLTEHMKIHNNDKRFVCVVCNKAFTQKCTLKGHMKIHEKIEDKSDEHI